VFEKLSDWFDDRTGFRKLLDALLIEHIPGGARWRYVWGSCLLFVFVIQLVTGLLLMTAYSPGDSTAWSSVYFIQYEMDFGWLIRGLHHFGSQTMVVLLGVHMLQVVIAGAHLPPREVNWWLGLGLLGCVLGLSLTGYLLPWDQKGYWATQVATNIAGNLPKLGPFIQKLAVGGPVYGHHTLTRFFTLHVAVLPTLVVILAIAHLAVFRRHGVTAPSDAEGEGEFWPDQAFRDMLVSMLIFGVMLGLVLYGHGHAVAGSSEVSDPSAGASGAAPGLWSQMARAGRNGLGANLDAPADPSRAYPARPEWYFLFLFQLLKYFPGESEVIGTVLIPGLAGFILFLLPLLGIGRMRTFGHVVGVIVITGMLAGVGVLTYLAIAADNADTPEAAQIRKEKGQAHELAARAIQLASRGVPEDGAVYLLRRDPQTQGRNLFQVKCAGCHNHSPEFTGGEQAGDLAGFGTEKWIRDLLRDPADPKYFGHTKLNRMAKWVSDTRAKAEGDAEKLAQFEKELDEIARWLAGHPRGLPEEEDRSEFARGYRAFEKRCSQCHKYEEEGGGDLDAPDFTAYGSIDWLRFMVMAPDHAARYGERNEMPAFRNLDGPGSEVTRLEFSERNPKTKLQSLSDVQRELIIRWLVSDDHVVFGGEPVSASREH
jgi:quinol-cytochrome oxidoreductase complex cytochrome b subunit/mono/diheme cytochrome c family protein